MKYYLCVREIERKRRDENSERTRERERGEREGGREIYIDI